MLFIGRALKQLGRWMDFLGGYSRSSRTYATRRRRNGQDTHTKTQNTDPASFMSKPDMDAWLIPTELLLECTGAAAVLTSSWSWRWRRAQRNLELEQEADQ